MVDLGIAKLLSCNYSIKLSSPASYYGVSAKLCPTTHTLHNSEPDTLDPLNQSSLVGG